TPAEPPPGGEGHPSVHRKRSGALRRGGLWPWEECPMGKLVGIALLLALGICGALLLHRAFDLPAPVEPPALPRPGATFGGMYRRMLGDNPVTLDPALVTDIYGGAVVRQLFDGLVQVDAHLKLLPALAEFWEASRDGCTWTFTLRRGIRF